MKFPHMKFPHIKKRAITYEISTYEINNCVRNFSHMKGISPYQITITPEIYRSVYANTATATATNTNTNGCSNIMDAAT